MAEFCVHHLTLLPSRHTHPLTPLPTAGAATGARARPGARAVVVAGAGAGAGAAARNLDHVEYPALPTISKSAKKRLKDRSQLTLAAQLAAASGPVRVLNRSNINRTPYTSSSNYAAPAVPATAQMPAPAPAGPTAASRLAPATPAQRPLDSFEQEEFPSLAGTSKPVHRSQPPPALPVSLRNSYAALSVSGGADGGAASSGPALSAAAQPPVMRSEDFPSLGQMAVAAARCVWGGQLCA